MTDQLYAESVTGKVALDLDEEVHRLAETLLVTEPVMLGNAGTCGRRMGHAVDAVLGVHRVYRRHRRVMLRVWINIMKFSFSSILILYDFHDN